MKNEYTYNYSYINNTCVFVYTLRAKNILTIKKKYKTAVSNKGYGVSIFLKFLQKQLII